MKAAAQLIERLDQQDFRRKRTEDRLARVVSPSQLITEARATQLLGVGVVALARWRKEKPSPRIQFNLTEGDMIRRRVASIEAYLKSRERGAEKGTAK
jgi:hypothetical protein